MRGRYTARIEAPFVVFMIGLRINRLRAVRHWWPTVTEMPRMLKALEADPDIGLLLPCNVVVREEEDGSNTVAFMDPVAVLNLVDKEGIEELAGEVRTRLERVRDSLT